MSLLSGSIASAIVLSLVGQIVHAPSVAVGCVTALAAAMLLGLIPSVVVWSGWRVPRQWRQYGYRKYAAIFGSVLGVGYATEVPTVGFYAIPIWFVSAASWRSAAAVAVAFGVGRLIPVGAGVRRDRADAIQSVAKLRQRAGALAPVELALLVALTICTIKL